MDAPRWAVEYVELTMSPSYPLSWAAIGGNGSVFVPEDPPAADFDLDLGIERSDDFEMKSHRSALKLNPRFLDIWTFKDIWIFGFSAKSSGHLHPASQIKRKKPLDEWPHTDG